MSDVIDLFANKKERDDLNKRVAACMYELLGKPPGQANQRLAEMLAQGWMSEETVSELEACLRDQLANEERKNFKLIISDD